MIELRTLGGLELRGAGGPELHSVLTQPKRLAFLAYLALATPRGFHRRDTLLALFWPESDATHARASLRKTLHVLRRSLGEDILVARGDEELSLDNGPLWCDARAFEEALESGRLEEALELYRGDLLPGFFIPDAPGFEQWLEGERTRLRRRASDAGWALVGRAEAHGNLPLAAHWARRAAAWSPDDEGALGRLITLLDRSGDRAGAVRAYEQFARRLAAEYEVEPSAETQALIAAVRSRAETSPGGSKAPSAPSRQADVTGGKAASAVLAGRYTVERQVGRGGLATVLLARDLEHDRLVTLKVLRPEVTGALDAKWFLRELEPVASLRHPHIAPVHDAGEADGLVYYAMPQMEGASLRERLARERELPIPEAVRILRDMADALTYAHSRGVVHHDIKPSRVLLAGGQAILLDFGVAKAIRTAAGRGSASSTGIAVGTPAYMAPEQVLADPVTDHRADIYALGAVAYVMLVGRPPFGGASPQEVFAAQVLGTPEPVGNRRAAVPPALGALVMRCLEKRPADRPQAAAELLHAIDALLA